MKKRKKSKSQPYSTEDYDVQATPLTIQQLGWQFIKDVAREVRKNFLDSDFAPLMQNHDGSSSPNHPSGKVKIMYLDLPKPVDDVMVYPYLDADGIKVLYVQFVNETFLDSFAVPDGPNRITKHEPPQQET